MITLRQFIADRDRKIYEMRGKRRKLIADEFNLSESRVKAIIAAQRRKNDTRDA